jgi:predicted RNA-binding protein Jag
VEVVVVKEGRSGILGLGAEDAVIRVTPIRPSPKAQERPEESGTEQVAREILNQLLSLMGLSGTIKSQPLATTEEAKPGEALPISLDVRGDDDVVLPADEGQCIEERRTKFLGETEMEGLGKEHIDADSF